MATSDSFPLPFFDPHFHVWDMTAAGETGNVTKSGHDSSILFSPKGEKLYGKVEYEREYKSGAESFEHVGGVFIEANSVCFVGKTGEEITHLYKAEMKWVQDTLCPPNSGADKAKYLYVASASLEDPQVGEYLKEFASIPSVVGIRQIINFKPSWPRNDTLGELLDNKAWLSGFKTLADLGLAFDMQLNPSQFQKALGVIKANPSAKVILNHAGCPTMKDLSDPEIAENVYWKGMSDLASCPNVHVKISMLCRPDPENWDTNDITVNLVHRLIKLFGFERVAFASNAPVDGNDKWPATRVIDAFKRICSIYTREQQELLFAGAARRMYSR
jgi:predicted TIM-barrel fold metal-dependent hydrolase